MTYGDCYLLLWTVGGLGVKMFKNQWFKPSAITSQKDFSFFFKQVKLEGLETFDHITYINASDNHLPLGNQIFFLYISLYF